MKPISSSERKGILVVALVAMVITSAGYFISLCERASTASAPSAPPPAEVLLTPDSSLLKKGKLMRGKKSRRDSARKKRKKRATSPKTWPTRSPRDELIPQ